MKKIIFIILILTSEHFCFSQRHDDWIENLNLDKLYLSNKLNNFNSYNFSSLFIPQHNFLGFIGDNYQRLNIYFTSVYKNKMNPNLYHVTGISLVGNNKCDFEGTFELTQIRERKHMNYGVDNIYKDSGMKSQGILIGKYKFSEDPTQKHVGLFEGLVTLWYYIDKHGVLRYDDIREHSDGFRNNQWIGTWTEYNKSDSKICNWGTRRIPFSGDLDIGAGEFYPNPEYKKYGWSDWR